MQDASPFFRCTPSERDAICHSVAPCSQSAKSQRSRYIYVRFIRGGNRHIKPPRVDRFCAYETCHFHRKPEVHRIPCRLRRFLNSSTRNSMTCLPRSLIAVCTPPRSHCGCRNAESVSNLCSDANVYESRCARSFYSGHYQWRSS